MILSTSRIRCHQAKSSISSGRRSKTQNGDQNLTYPSLISLSCMTAKFFPLKIVLKNGRLFVLLCLFVCCNTFDVRLRNCPKIRYSYSADLKHGRLFVLLCLFVCCNTFDVRLRNCPKIRYSYSADLLDLQRCN